MKKILLVMLSSIITLNACSGCNEKEYVPPKPTPVVTDTEYCKPAEQHLKELKCIPSDKPYTKKGLSFEQFCHQTQDNGIYLNPRCLANISSCEEIDYCTGTKVK